MLHFPFKLAQHIKDTDIKDTEVITMRTWVITAPSNPIYNQSRGFKLIYALFPKNAESMFALMCQAFKMQPEIHNSADRGISKFIYLRLHLVVCFYPRPPAWPWSWGHMYRQNSINEHVWSECYCLFNCILKLAQILPFQLLWIRVSEPREYHHSRVHHLTRGQELVIQFGSFNNN